jgi:hypothetical protein
MNNHDLSVIKKAINVLVNQPLRKLYRCGGASIFANFGELVEVAAVLLDENKKIVRDENGEKIWTKKTIPRYALHTECSMRLSCGCEIVLAKADIYLPCSDLENKPDFNWEGFDWDVIGDNRFDELVAKYLNQEPYGFIVKKITVNKFGDLAIVFENEFVLEFFADASGEDENWRFFDTGTDDPHLVVCGYGIVKAEEMFGK